MLDHTLYMQQLSDLLRAAFGDSILYIGLQGSYIRGEASEHSDIDPMVVFDSLTPENLKTYKQIISSLQEPEKHCGFVCGCKELKNWNPLEICPRLHTTVDYFGELKTLLPPYTKSDIENYIKLSVGNLYHEICHRYLHGSDDRNAAKIVDSYKSVFFILQNVYYLKTGTFPKTKVDLFELTTGADRAILSKVMALGDGYIYEYDELFSSLLNWCSDMLTR